jgi:hypothetical protein
MSIASRYWTYAELLAKVERDLDIEGETFVQPDEMLGYANEAIDDCERIVKGVYPDYFLDKDTITLVTSTKEYSLPSRIYAHKIRRMVYRNGGEVYTIPRIKDWRKFETYEVEQTGSGSSHISGYFILNSTAGAPKILFPQVNVSGEYVQVWFVRQANRLVETTDVLDIPEASNYVMQHMKVRAYEKEGHPNLTLATQILVGLRADLEGDLAEMVPDADNELEMDTSFYEDMN